MARVAKNSIFSLVAIAGCAVLFCSTTASAQSRSSTQRANPKVQQQCMRAAQARVPGAPTDTGVMEQRTALYQSCVRNGGRIPGRRG
jgi:hypothetical protein